MGGWHRRAASAASGLRSLGADADAAEPLNEPTASHGTDRDPAPVGTGRVTPRTVGTLFRHTWHHADAMFDDAARLGEVVRYSYPANPGQTVVISNPAHVRALLTANPRFADTAARLYPIRPVVGRSSVLTSVGPWHAHQRDLLLPRFHGVSLAGHRAALETATDRALSTLPIGTARLARIAESVALDVILTSLLGPREQLTDAETHLRGVSEFLLWASGRHIARVAQMVNSPWRDAQLLNRPPMWLWRRNLRHVISERRRSPDPGDDVLGLLLRAHAPDGSALTDAEISDELLTLLLGGHETTGNAVAWTFERLTRHRRAYHAVRDAALAGEDDVVQSAVLESLRSRPVVPYITRELMVPWRFGDHIVPAGTVAEISVLLLHHRDDLYPRPFAFTPERFHDARPAPFTLLPFGGGHRRCLGAPLANAEITYLVREILRRTELRTHDRPGEPARHRNVTMVPAAGARVQVLSVR
ncbi:cytochrome P450 [Tsukamurella sp. NPDC003166]|uniref:cytochrome P450 n=1 Tax=Tsukamurella sp. NPDC003166 TaxID=3154444 RepID=UPI0033B7F9ED